MSHALIIDDNMVVGRAVQSRLGDLGFDSFDHTWTSQQALEAAAQRRPDLIVTGLNVANGSPLAVARKVAAVSRAPILAVSADQFMFETCVRDGASVEGPHHLSKLDVVLAPAHDGP